MKLLEVIASGGFGRVERVELDDGRIVARKVFDPRVDLREGVDIAKLRKRFAREVRVQTALTDSLFIPILQSDLQADPPWFVMPLAEATLEQRIDALRRDGKELLTALGHVLDSLEHLHSLDFVHRDLKPSNILFHAGRWKLSDFGLVLPMTSKTTKLSTQLSAWGTIGYCAPEQAIEFANVTPAADVFAFGCILHDLFGNSARVPYQRATCPGPLGAVIERCTEFDPRRRFKALSSLRASILDVLVTPPVPAGDGDFSPQAKELGGKLADVEAMQPADLEQLVRYLRSVEEPSEAGAIFIALNDERLVALKHRDADAWHEIAVGYCDWAQIGGFDFEYCDVIVGRLLVIFDHGSAELKARAALAAAVLGESHNRYHVMHRVLSMCGPKLDENIARRIAVEIRASEMHEQFRACAYVIQREVTDYHPVIAAVLSEAKPAEQDRELDDDMPF